MLEEIENLGAKPGSMPIKTCMKALLNLAGGGVSSREACFVLVRLQLSSRLHHKKHWHHVNWEVVYSACLVAEEHHAMTIHLLYHEE